MSRQITKLVARIWDKISAPMISKLHTKPPTPTYEFIEDPINDTTHIHITSGKAAGVVFRYGRVRFEEINQQLNVRFGYEIIRNPNLLTDAVVKPIIIGILNNILIEEGTHGQN